MLRIKDSRHIVVTAKLNEAGDPVKVTADVLKIRMFRYDEVPEPSVEVVGVMVDQDTYEEIGPFKQFTIKGQALKELMTPKADQTSRDFGDFRISDLEDVLVAHGPVHMERDATLKNHFKDIVKKLERSP